jgi:hypothetical protein
MQCAHTHRITSPNKIVHNWTWQEWAFRMAQDTHNLPCFKYEISQDSSSHFLHENVFSGHINYNCTCDPAISSINWKVFTWLSSPKTDTLLQRSVTECYYSWTHILQNPPHCSVRLCCFKCLLLHYYISIKFYQKKVIRRSWNSTWCWHLVSQYNIIKKCYNIHEMKFN